MNNYEQLELMLSAVANGLGDEILEQVAFVGGCVVGLLLTDEFTRQQVRATDDVDLIVDAVSYADYAKLQSVLRARGFKESMEDDVQCRWRLGELIVDVMPTDEKILGFSNRWYKTALETAKWHALASGSKIKVVSAPYFLATKMEAFSHRGKNDFLASRDIEDIVNLIDGREELSGELLKEGEDLHKFCAKSLREYLNNSNFEYAVESAARGGREEVVFERIEKIISA